MSYHEAIIPRELWLEVQQILKGENVVPVPSVDEVADLSASDVPQILDGFFVIKPRKDGNNEYLTAMFDARVFSIPKDEVCNCLIWRQQDATRNSIESVGHANFSQKELHGKSCNSIQDMLWKERGINWNDFPVDCKRGSACYKTKVKETAPLLNDKGDTEMVEVVRNRWVIDREPPIFSQERGYVEKWI